MIPKNPIGALANGEMLQIIIFAMIVGIILAKLSEKTETVLNFLQQGNDIMMEMTMMVMRLAPFGVFCLIAKTFTQIGFDGFKPMILYMASVFIALGVQCFGVYLVMLKIFTGLNPFRFVIAFVGVNGLIEAAACFVVGSAITKALQVAMKNK